MKSSDVIRVSKHRAATRWRSVNKLSPCGCAEPRPNSSRSDWNEWRKNTLRVPLTTTIPTGRSMLLQQRNPRSPYESVPCWVTSCKKFACAKHSLFYWEPVRKIMPGETGPLCEKVCRPPDVSDGWPEGRIAPTPGKLNIKTGPPLRLYSVLAFFWFSLGCFFTFSSGFSGDAEF